jgi:hypothetical protein
MKTLMLIVSLLFIGCSHMPTQEASIGPCYGSARTYQGFVCFYDVDKDQNPDIALIYTWDGERLTLIDTAMIDEFRK